MLLHLIHIEGLSTMSSFLPGAFKKFYTVVTEKYPSKDVALDWVKKFVDASDLSPLSRRKALTDVG